MKRKVAGYLLQSKAILLEPAKPFTWASGWRSPIYCDNRITLSFPEIRNFFRDSFVQVITRRFGTPDIIAAVATGAIAHGALVADKMGLPLAYVRSSPKEHGRRNLVEGKVPPGDRVVVVEDLVSTGGSSLSAVHAIREAGATVVGMVAIFSYGFREALDRFRENQVELLTLTDYETLADLALREGFISGDQLELLQRWRTDPSSWKSGSPLSNNREKQ